MRAPRTGKTTLPSSLLRGLGRVIATDQNNVHCLSLGRPMTHNTHRLPAFDNPPVIETAVGVEFSPLQKWSIPHYGLFWHHIKADYPVTRTIFPPLPAPD